MRCPSEISLRKSRLSVNVTGTRQTPEAPASQAQNDRWRWGMRGSGISLAVALRRAFLAIGVVVLLGVTPARGETIDFAELPLGTPIDGKTVKGVTFGYA